MAHAWSCTCKKCCPSIMDSLFGPSKSSGKKPNFTSRSGKSQQSRSQSADRAAQSRDRRDRTSPHNDGIKSSRNPKRY